jgi:hypothetical protein
VTNAEFKQVALLAGTRVASQRCFPEQQFPNNKEGGQDENLTNVPRKAFRRRPDVQFWARGGG